MTILSRRTLLVTLAYIKGEHSRELDGAFQLESFVDWQQYLGAQSVEIQYRCYWSKGRSRTVYLVYKRKVLVEAMTA